MKLNDQQRAERLRLYGLVQSLSYVVRLNDPKTAQHLPARLALALRSPVSLTKRLRNELEELFEISGVWVRNVDDRHNVKGKIKQLNRRIIPRLKGSLTRRKSADSSAARHSEGLE